MGRINRSDDTETIYRYDLNGNRLSRTTGVEVTSYSYDEQDRLLTAGDATFSYQPAGELLQKTDNGETVTYDYDSVGNLRAVSSIGQRIEYAVDGWGRRIAKFVDGEPLQAFLYQDLLRPLAEFDGDGNLVSQFVYASRINVPEYILRDARTYRVLTDQLGSPRLIVDIESGVIAQELEYDEFGRVLRDTNPGFQPFGFAGGLYDRDTGLVRFGARDYDPELGRWTAKDPIGFAGGQMNLYAYVNSDPVNAIDPSGLISLWDVADFYFFVQSVRDLVNCPSWGNGANVGLNAIGLLPGIPGVGTARRISDAAPALLVGAVKGIQREKKLPLLDASGKVHGTLPSAKDLGKFSDDALRDLKGLLEGSVKTRIGRTSKLGRHRPHGQRQGEEQALIKQIEKHLSKS